MPVLVEKKPPVTTVILDRAEARNAVDRETAEALADAFREFEADEEMSAAVLWGANGTFCAGADLKAIAAGQPNRVAPDGDAPMGPTRMILSKPVVAAVAGYAVAGGLELALWCDLRVAESNAVFGVFCRRWGVPLIDCGTLRLPRLVGHGRAMDLILTGRPVAAEEALAMGLVNRVVPAGTSRTAAEELARELAAFPQAALRGDRLSAIEQWDMEWADAVANELAHGRNALAEGTAGAGRFGRGAGRHGAFGDGSSAPVKGPAGRGGREA